jgi:3-deoxy-D-manno-octulosonic-acid transferase
MSFIYNIALCLASAATVAGRHLGKGKSKFGLFSRGQKHLIATIQQELGKNDGEVCWIHVASLGEYNVVKPLMHELRKKYVIVLTFFSSTGIEALHGLSYRYTEADHIFYLPLDTRHNANKFLDIVRPSRAVFGISEYWPNYLKELGKRHIPTFIVSQLVGEKSSLMQWYGKWLYRAALKSVTTFMVLNEESKQNLESLGFKNVIVTGDSLFDNASAIAATAYQNSIVEHFCKSGGGKVFIAGSISDKKDLKLIATLANKHKDVKFIFVPHEISREGIYQILYEVEGKVQLYSDSSDTDDFKDVQVLVIDFLGALARLYRYGTWVYVGGGFTPFLHSLVEPVAYGLPVSFGPCIGRKTTPSELIRLGIGEKVSAFKDLDKWFINLKDNDALLHSISESAKMYVSQNAGSTRQVVSIIERG